MQAQGKDVRALRSLFYLTQAYVSCGAAGSPTLYDPALGALLASAPALGVCLRALRSATQRRFRRTPAGSLAPVSSAA